MAGDEVRGAGSKRFDSNRYDVSVTGFDGVDLPWLPHRLTTMDQHGQDKGRILGTFVRRSLEGARPRAVTQSVHLREGTTVARAS